MSELDAYFDRLRVGAFGASDPNVVPQQVIAVGDGNAQPSPFLANAPATVVIDDTGLAITNGKLTVTNPGGTVIIDGTSNMFKIAATATSVGADWPPVGTTWTSSAVLSGTGSAPAALLAVAVKDYPTASDYRAVGSWSSLDTSGAVQARLSGYSYSNGTDNVIVMVRESILTQPVGAPGVRFYILKEAAI